MPSVFTPILEGQLDVRVVWRDERCVALHALEPLREGHVVVVPRAPVDHWLDLDEPTALHVMGVARVVGQAVQRAFQPEKVGVFVLGLKVRHAHLHLVPVWEAKDLVEPGPQPVDGERSAEILREHLRALGVAAVVDG